MAILEFRESFLRETFGKQKFFVRHLENKKFLLLERHLENKCYHSNRILTKEINFNDRRPKKKGEVLLSAASFCTKEAKSTNHICSGGDLCYKKWNAAITFWNFEVSD